MIDVNTIVINPSSLRLKVTRIWPGGWYDLVYIDPPYPILPDYKPEVWSSTLYGYTI